MAAVEVHKKQVELDKQKEEYSLILKSGEENNVSERQKVQVKIEVPKKVEKPTLENLPPQRKRLESNAGFNYSLCESIDYQQESLLGDERYEMNS